MEKVEFHVFNERATYVLTLGNSQSLQNPEIFFETFPAFARQWTKMLLAIEHALVEGAQSIATPEVRVHSHNRHGGRRSGFRRYRPAPGRSGFLEYEVRVATAEAEYADACTFRIGLLLQGPWSIGTDDLRPRKSIPGGCLRLLYLDRGRNEIVLHPLDHFDHPRHSGCGQQMTQIGFHRTNQRHGRRIVRREKGFHGGQFDFVAEGRTRRVAFHVIDALRVYSRVLVGPFKTNDLPSGVRAQYELAFPVVGQSAAKKRRMDGVAVTHGVFVAFEEQHARAFAREQPLRAPIQGCTHSVLGISLKDGETHVHEHRVGGAHGTGQHQIGGAGSQVVACELRGIERRGTGRIEGEPDAAQSQ